MLTDLEVAQDIGAKLDALGIPWVIVGSVATCRAIADDYYVDEETARWAASTRRSFNVIHQTTITKVDIFCCKSDPLSRAQLQRRIFEQVAGRSMPFLAPEDAILQKLRWLQELGTSEQQWRDALGVLRVRWNVLDREYLDAQARDNGLDELLQKLLAEREPS